MLMSATERIVKRLLLYITIASAVFLISAGADSEERWFAMGCYKSGARHHLLRDGELRCSSMNYTMCRDFCRQRLAKNNTSFVIIGLTQGSICNCGLTVQNNAARLDDSQCGQECPGDSEQLCGGPGAIQVFNVTGNGQAHRTFGEMPAQLENNATININESIIAVSLKGCYKTTGHGGILSRGAFKINPVTPQSCLARCKIIYDGRKRTNQFLYGLNYGKRCYCGRVLRNKPKRLPMEKCMWTCLNQTSEYCGTSIATIVYSATVSNREDENSSSEVTSTQHSTEDTSLVHGTEERFSVLSSESFNLTQNSTLGPEQVSVDVLKYKLVIKDSTEQEDSATNFIANMTLVEYGDKGADSTSTPTISTSKSEPVRPNSTGAPGL